MPIDREGWTATADSAEDGIGPENAIDGDTSTLWHTQWKLAAPSTPHEIIIDMGGNHWVDSLIYTPRTDGSSNGNINQYEVWVSSDNQIYGRVASGTMDYTTIPINVEFLIPNLVRYVKLIAVDSVGGKPWTTAAEIEITESLPDIVIEGGGVQ